MRTTSTIITIILSIISAILLFIGATRGSMPILVLGVWFAVWASVYVIADNN